MHKALHAPERLDITRPSPARIYDCLLGGGQYADADARAAERILRVVPEIRDTAWSNRGYHQRAATWIARQGVRQFLDLGCGLPAVGNTHEVVKKIHPEARVVYVDIDPLVELHSQAIIASGGTISVLRGDLREPAAILGDHGLQALIDPSEPTGLLLTAVMMFVSAESDPWGLVSRYVRAMAPGSYLSLTHLTDDAKPPAAVEAVRQVYDGATEQLYFRPKADVARFFGGLEMVPPYPGAEPALAYGGVWGAEDPELADSDGSRWLYGGVARIP